MEEIGYAESGGFELNTLDGSSVSGLGFSDSGGFELDTQRFQFGRGEYRP